jgi:hypothetical protein
MIDNLGDWLDVVEARKEADKVEAEADAAEEIGTVYVLMQVVRYEGEYLKGVYVTEAQARRAAGGRPEDFYGPMQTWRIHAVKMNDALQGYF